MRETHATRIRYGFVYRGPKETDFNKIVEVPGL